MPTVLSPEEIADRRNPRKARNAKDSYSSDQSLLGDNTPRRTREQSAARPLSQLPGLYKLPAISKNTYPEQSARSSKYPKDRSGGWRDWDDWDKNDLDPYPDSSIGVELEPVRDLVPVPSYPIVSLSTDSVPDLAAFRPMLVAGTARRRINTQMLIERARSPWSISRTILAVLMMLVALFATIGGMGEPSQALMESAFNPFAGAVSAPTTAGRVVAETQMTCSKCYDNNAQFQAWGNADCSAAVASEVLTAWQVQGATIGKLIDTMGPDISLNGGLLRTTGFQRGV
ncbi:MAG: hypothetical protein C5B60_04260, partial [Chloroflexi bacterium]